VRGNPMANKIRVCPKCKNWKPGRINIGIHTLSEVNFYDRVINHIPKATFNSIIKKIEKDLNKEHA
jgi:hypothetical protein